MNLTGAMELKAEKKAERTILSHCYYEGALKLTRPVYLDEHAPSVYMIHVGGGYVDGDVYTTKIHAAEEAEVSVTTQSHTKVYKTPKEPVVQKTSIHMEENSLVEYMPDPLIAYEKARFVQETDVYMEEGARLIYSDMMTPGWAEDGRAFSYDWIRSRLKIYRNGRLVVFDHLFLEPDESISGLMQMEGYSHAGMLMVIHEKVDEAFIESVCDLLEKMNLEARFGISELPVKGFMLRILAQNTKTLEELIYKAHDEIRSRLLQKDIIRWRKY
ncbi:urease accessory protein UreD [Alkalicoccus saliphilus]|jgi:urease accessory protein|uniref:Urease accessory protein UreD n=1 Tax=Alkalicoccus saliphilus TaxID=200989 RepID=A0A2T4U551_9BACI|nr:urease accessory protein UreD [Alkalicoccus saliphilus]PTL38533.1 urease accessory protein ureD [Alkalicoccus saliphilus]